MSFPKVTLHYFPLRGRGEVIRLVLHAVRRDFEDNIINFKDWASVKPQTPFGSLPYLEINGEPFAQGQALATYLAKESGLYGVSNLDGLRIEQIQQLREDLLVNEVKVWMEKDEIKKAELTKSLNETIYSNYLSFFERLIKENQGRSAGSPFAVGNKLSLADIVIFEGTETLRQKNPALLDSYPLVKALNELVASQDGIKQYLEKRPVVEL